MEGMQLARLTCKQFRVLGSIVNSTPVHRPLASKPAGRTAVRGQQPHLEENLFLEAVMYIIPTAARPTSPVSPPESCPARSSAPLRGRRCPLSRTACSGTPAFDEPNWFQWKNPELLSNFVARPFGQLFRPPRMPPCAHALARKGSSRIPAPLPASCRRSAGKGTAVPQAGLCALPVPVQHHHSSTVGQACQPQLKPRRADRGREVSDTLMTTAVTDKSEQKYVPVLQRTCPSSSDYQ